MLSVERQLRDLPQKVDCSVLRFVGIFGFAVEHVQTVGDRGKDKAEVFDRAFRGAGEVDDQALVPDPRDTSG